MTARAGIFAGPIVAPEVTPAAAPPPTPPAPPAAIDPALAEETRKRKNKLVEHVTGDPAGLPIKDDEAGRADVNRRLTAFCATEFATLFEAARTTLVQEAMAELFGFGPIQPLLDDPSVTEVMVNGPHRVYVERKGRSVRTNVRFNDDDHVRRIIDRIVIPLGRRVDADNPLVDARMPDGSRVNAVIAPVAIDGPSITIRKFGKQALTVDDLVRFGSTIKHHRLRRHRLGENHFAQRALQLYPG
jgi:pilus assembly protein CpaF